MVTHAACILTIGNELLNGDVVNTNASWLGGRLRSAGIPCRTILTVGDSHASILQALKQIWQDHDLIIVSGGLGPTRDDVTKKALAEFFDDVLVRDIRVLEHVTSWFKKRGREISEVNRQQADIPQKAKILFNDLGTAPGLLIEQDRKLLAAMPGVPYELHYITEKRLIPELEVRWKKSERRVQQAYLRTIGIGESDLSGMVLKELEDRIPGNVDIAFLPHPSGVDIRITEINGNADSVFFGFAEWVKKQAGVYVYSEDYQQSLPAAMVALLIEKNRTVSFAESCTGGYLANALTDIPGSSHCVKGGFVAYDNAVKSGQLDIPVSLIERHGAVSAPVALAMAEAAGKKMNADFGISTTGIAGPEGGTPEKPVGTVWIGFWSHPRNSKPAHFACRYHFSTERLVNKERSFAAAMDILRRNIKGISGFPHNPYVVTASESTPP